MQDAKWSLVRLALLTALLLPAVGCDLTGQSTNQSGSNPKQGPVAMSDDPLKSSQLPPVGLTAQPPNRAAASNTHTPATGATGSVPPIPTPSTTTSTGVLAGGGVQGNLPPSDGRDLRIVSGSSVPSAGSAQLPTAWETTPRGSGSPVGGSGVALAGASGNADGFQALQVQLKQRNVAWQKLEMQGDSQWKFSCSVPNRANPNYRSLVESVSADPLEAIRQAINEIDNAPQPTTPPAGPHS